MKINIIWGDLPNILALKALLLVEQHSTTCVIHSIAFILKLPAVLLFSKRNEIKYYTDPLRMKRNNCQGDVTVIQLKQKH